MTRLVVDASVLVSASVALPNSHSARLLEAVCYGEAEMVVCPQLLAEVERTLGRRYFAARLTPEERTAFLELLSEVGVARADPVSPPSVVRDPGDDYLVALAVASNADAIVTGDRDLLDHDGLVPPAITARQACRQLRLPDD